MLSACNARSGLASREAPRNAMDFAWSPAACRAAGLVGWTLVIGCVVWRGPFRFVLGTLGAGLLARGAAHGRRSPPDARSAIRRNTTLH